MYTVYYRRLEYSFVFNMELEFWRIYKEYPDLEDAKLIALGLATVKGTQTRVSDEEHSWTEPLEVYDPV